MPRFIKPENIPPLLHRFAKQSYGIAALNLSVLVLGFFWASQEEQAGVYDITAIELKELVLPVANLDLAREFYISKLGFRSYQQPSILSMFITDLSQQQEETVMTSDEDSVTIGVPGLVNLRLEKVSDGRAKIQAVVRFAVRNSIKHLHQTLLKQIGTATDWQENWSPTYETAQQVMKAGSISSLITVPKKKSVFKFRSIKFFVKDVDSNILEYTFRWQEDK